MKNKKLKKLILTTLIWGNRRLKEILLLNKWHMHYQTNAF